MKIEEGNMSDDEVAYSDDELDEWVERDSEWKVVADWRAYLLARRQSYLADRQRSLGQDYYSSSAQWDVIFEREWMVMEERLNIGLGLDEDVLAHFGEDFFTEDNELMAELRNLTDGMDSEEIEENVTLTIYTFEDFLMLSNQGIFRDNIFILDPQRKWRKKVEEIVKSYGYSHIERMVIRGENYLVVSKEEY